MKLKMIKYIIVCFFASIILGNIMFSVVHKNYSLANALFFVASISVQFILSIVNLIILFINQKNYYYLVNCLFFLPQLAIVIIFLMLEENSKDSIITFYIPFFIVQTLFYFRVRKLFSDLEI